MAAPARLSPAAGARPSRAEPWRIERRRLPTQAGRKASTEAIHPAGRGSPSERASRAALRSAHEEWRRERRAVRDGGAEGGCAPCELSPEVPEKEI